MSGVLRFDTGSLGKVQRTPQGGIRVPATLTRSGLFRYVNPDGSTRIEYRPPSEVFRADSLATLQDAPVTNLHHGMIDASNWRKTSVGTVSGEARQDGDKVAAVLAIQDARTIGLIESDERREISCGYRCRIDHTPGRTPEGEPYDVSQTEIVYNHVALVPRGRGGREVALRLDSAENQIRPEGQGDPEMKIEIIGGVEYEVGTAAHRKAVEFREDAEKTSKERLDSVSTLEGENKALKAENEKLQARLDKAPEDLQKAVRARVALVEHAVKAKVEIKEDMADADIQRAVIAKVLPEIDLDEKDQAFVDGVFAVAIRQIGASGSSQKIREDAHRKRRGDEDREDAADDLPPDIKARNKMIKAGQNRPTVAG